MAARAKRITALAVELGDVAGDPSTDLSDDPLVGSYQLAVLAPLSSADQYDLLAAAGPLSASRCSTSDSTTSTRRSTSAWARTDGRGLRPRLPQ